MLESGTVAQGLSTKITVKRLFLIALKKAKSLASPPTGFLQLKKAL